MKAVFLDAGTLVPLERFAGGIQPETLDRQHWDISPETLINSCDSVTFFSATTREQIIERCHPADIIITNKVVIDHDIIQSLPNLKLICVAATGINNLDVAAAENAKLAVTNVAGYSTYSVVQICFTLLLNLASRFNATQRALTERGWHNHHQFVLLPESFSELKDKTFGIIGFGTIGQAVGNVAESFGMKVIKAQLPGRPAKPDYLALNEFLAQSDVVSLHCPQTEHTTQLVDESFLAQMKTSAILINTARGGLIDESALAEALKKERIAGAGLDVLSNEPPSSENPLLQPLPNLILSPHLGWASQEARQRLVNELAENIAAFKQQKRRNRIV